MVIYIEIFLFCLVFVSISKTYVKSAGNFILFFISFRLLNWIRFEYVLELMRLLFIWLLLLYVNDRLYSDSSRLLSF